MFSFAQQEESSRQAVFKLFLLAFISGSINAGGYLACHSFVTHVTGFATLFGVEVASGRIGHAIGYLSVPLFFLLGTMISAWLIDLRIARGLRPHYTIVMGLVSACMLLAVIGGTVEAFGIFGDAIRMEKDFLLLILLCGASGLLNAAITSASGATARITHLTGITTDLGIGLIRTIFSHGEPKQLRRERSKNLSRFGTIVSFGVGGVCGATLFLKVHYLGFLLPSVLALFAGYLSYRSRRERVASA